MVQAQINIPENVNKVLGIIKIQNGLRSKSEAIAFVTKEYEENFMEPELRPEFVKKIRRIEKERNFTTYKSIDDLRKDIENA